MLTLTRIKKATGEFIKVLRYGNKDLQTCEPILPFGIDSKPIKEILGIHSETSELGVTLILGYVYKSEITSEGETRIFCTDSGGVEQFFIYLKNDGTIEFNGNADNLVRYSKLEEAYNQLKSDHDNTVSKLNALITLIKTTWVPVPNDGGAALKSAAASLQNAANSTGDITGAKINDMKVT